MCLHTSAESGHEQSSEISRGSGNKPSFASHSTLSTSVLSSPRSSPISEPIRPVHRPTTRRQRVLTSGVMPILTVYSSLPAT